MCLTNEKGMKTKVCKACSPMSTIMSFSKKEKNNVNNCATSRLIAKIEHIFLPTFFTITFLPTQIYPPNFSMYE